MTSDDELRRDILTILQAAISAVDPHGAVLANLAIEGGAALRAGARRYELAAIDRIIVVGGGKAGTPMAAAVHETLGDRIHSGAVNVKYGHTSAGGGWRVRFGFGGETIPAPERAQTGPIEIVEAGHPVPDPAGLAGSQRIAALLTGLSERDLVLVLISGGGSALLPLPVEGISLAEYGELTNALLRCGADIREINAVRKHCSRLQGGQLARLAAPAQVVTLILSDVVGTPLDAIASGPTVPDPQHIRRGLAGVGTVRDRRTQSPAGAREHLRRGVAGEIPDTPKPGDPLFERVNNVVIGDNAIAGRAAVAAAQALGYQSALLTTFAQGEAREVGRVVAGLAQGIATGQSDYRAPACLVLGGETTVTVQGSGMGGRNQELALSAGIALAGYPLPEGTRDRGGVARHRRDGRADRCGGRNRNAHNAGTQQGRAA